MDKEEFKKRLLDHILDSMDENPIPSLDNWVEEYKGFIHANMEGLGSMYFSIELHEIPEWKVESCNT